MQNISKLLEAKTIEALAAEETAIQASEVQRRRLLIRVWIPVFFACVITGLFGAAVLITRFVLNLIHS